MIKIEKISFFKYRFTMYRYIIVSILITINIDLFSNKLKGEDNRVVSNIDSYNRESRQETKLEDYSYLQYGSIPSLSSRKIVIATQRQYIKISKRGEYIDNSRYSDSGINYFLASKVDQHWVLTHCSSLKVATSYLPKSRNSVLFVHGYGKSVNSALKRSEKIDEMYGVNIILYDWPSKALLFYRAQHRAKKSSSGFTTLLNDYNNLKENNSLYLKSTLFMHSLGNLVFKEHLESSPNSPLKSCKVFDNIVLNAPAIPQKEHVSMLKQLNPDQNIIVTQNRYDAILRGAGISTLSTQLGNRIKTPKSLSVTYINFTDIAGLKHTLFCCSSNKHKKSDIEIHSIYNTIFNGIDSIFYRDNSLSCY